MQEAKVASMEDTQVSNTFVNSTPLYIVHQLVYTWNLKLRELTIQYNVPRLSVHLSPEKSLCVGISKSLG